MYGTHCACSPTLTQLHGTQLCTFLTRCRPNLGIQISSAFSVGCAQRVGCCLNVVCLHYIVSRIASLGTVTRTWWLPNFWGSILAATKRCCCSSHRDGRWILLGKG